MYASGPLFWGDCTLVGIYNEISVSVVATTLSMQKTRIINQPQSTIAEQEEFDMYIVWGFIAGG